MNTTSNTSTTPNSTTPTSTTDARTRLRPSALVAGIRDELGRQIKDPTAAYAALGASDVVAQRVGKAARHGAALAERVRRTDGADATHLPRLAVGQALTVAGRLEETYGHMATRGRGVAQRVKDGTQASELLRLAVVTLNRARPDRSSAVVVGETVTVTRETTAVKVGPDTASATTDTAVTTDTATVTPDTVTVTPEAATATVHANGTAPMTTGAPTTKTRATRKPAAGKGTDSTPSA